MMIVRVELLLVIVIIIIMAVMITTTHKPARTSTGNGFHATNVPDFDIQKR